VHPAVFDWVGKFATDTAVNVLDIGGRDVNGTCRPLFPNAARYTVIDLIQGPGVDIVGDAAEWNPTRRFDVVLCTEVFEHAVRWPEVCATAKRALAPGGVFVVTCAGPGRAPHSGFDGETVRDGEWYENVAADDLELMLRRLCFDAVQVHDRDEDVWAAGWRLR